MGENGFNDRPAPFRKWRAFIGTIEERIGQAFQGQGRPDEPLSAQISRFMQQFGFSSNPPNGTQAACIETEAGVCAVATDYAEGEPDLGSGWSAQYDTSGNVVKLMTTDGIEVTAADGTLVLTAATEDVTMTAGGANDVVIKSTGSGRVALGRGTQRKVARNTDSVIAGLTMATWISGVSASTGVPAPTDFGTISGGSSDVYAGD